jgi:hypothetical protein
MKLLNSSPYYAQANGQAEVANKGIIKLIKRKIDENPKRWHTILNEALWVLTVDFGTTRFEFTINIFMYLIF